MNKWIQNAGEKVLAGKPLTRPQALRLAGLNRPEDVFDLLSWSNRIRHRFKGDRIDLCSIINAKSGRCSEDCAFCAQSSRYSTRIKSYPLLSFEEMLDRSREAAESGAHRFSLVTSGRTLLNRKEQDRLCRVISTLSRGPALSPCASLGLLTPGLADALKEAGLRSYHHNLETAPQFYSRICTTHSFEERVKTIRLAQERGFRICSGGIIGLGETMEDRMDMAFFLKELKVDSVPMNFLNPIPGTPLEGQPQLPPLEILKTIALFRLILPEADIRTCGGRERGLRTLQPLMYLAGCNGTMIGNYLTTEGRNPREDIQEILDLGLTTTADAAG